MPIVLYRVIASQKSSRQSSLFQPVNFAGSWHFATTLCTNKIVFARFEVFRPFFFMSSFRIFVRSELWVMYQTASFLLWWIGTDCLGTDCSIEYPDWDNLKEFFMKINEIDTFWKSFKHNYEVESILLFISFLQNIIAVDLMVGVPYLDLRLFPLVLIGVLEWLCLEI